MQSLSYPGVPTAQLIATTISRTQWMHTRKMYNNSSPKFDAIRESITETAHLQQLGWKKKKNGVGKLWRIQKNERLCKKKKLDKKNNLVLDTKYARIKRQRFWCTLNFVEDRLGTLRQLEREALHCYNKKKRNYFKISPSWQLLDENTARYVLAAKAAAPVF